MRSRYQNPCESLHEFEAEISRLVRRAYPTVQDEVHEILATLCEVETHQEVIMVHPRMTKDALIQALTFIWS